MSRRGYSREQRLAWLEEQASSGLSVSAFCQRIGVSENSFYRWRRILGDQPEPAAATFLPVSVVDRAGIEIDLPCGAMVRIPSGCHDSMEQVLKILIQLGAET